MIAITGANGFIGSHLFKYLLKKGIKVRKITRNGADNSFAIGNLNSCTDWSKALENIEILIHCASITNFDDKKSSSIEELNEVNIKATKNMAEQASKMGVKKIIFISSIKVNGEITQKNKQFNNSSKAKPQTLYAISKYKAENILKKISNKCDLELVIIRPPLVYGEFVKGNFLSLINFVSLGIPLPLKIINNARSIIYVGNLVYFIYLCMFNSYAKVKTFLISDPNPISTPFLVRLLSKNLRKKILLFYCPKFLMVIVSIIFNKRRLLSSLIDSLEVDSSDSYKELNARAPFTTEEGIKKTINWFVNKQK